MSEKKKKKKNNCLAKRQYEKRQVYQTADVAIEESMEKHARKLNLGEARHGDRLSRNDRQTFGCEQKVPCFVNRFSVMLYGGIKMTGMA